MSSFRQIELFCQSDKLECNPDIATCLSDAAFKAVEGVVKVSMCSSFVGEIKNQEKQLRAYIQRLNINFFHQAELI